MKPDNTPTANVTAEGEAYLSPPRRLHYVDSQAPQNGEAVPIAPGVRWCRIPLPVDLQHINVWLVEVEDGCIVVDTGMISSIGEEAWHALEQKVFKSTPLRGVFITHLHPDHVGLARWLQQRYDIPVWMSARTHAQLQFLLSQEAQRAASDAAQYYTSHGVTKSSELPIFSPERLAQIISGLPEVAEFVDDDEVITWGGRAWRALLTNGHAEGHLCLLCEETGVLISGDQVLPTISSNIGLTWHGKDLNPLGSYLASLQRLHNLPRETLVLPSHGIPFRGLQARIEDLQAHHLKQLDALTCACEIPKTTVDILPVMYRRPLKDVHFVLGMAEALAHLEYLVADERLRREIDDSGVTRYVVRV